MNLARVELSKKYTVPRKQQVNNSLKAWRFSHRRKLEQWTEVDSSSPSLVPWLSVSRRNTLFRVAERLSSPSKQQQQNTAVASRPRSRDSSRRWTSETQQRVPVQACSLYIASCLMPTLHSSCLSMPEFLTALKPSGGSSYCSYCSIWN